MSAVPFHYVDLRTFCYATEDEKRVETALRTFLPEDTEIERDVTEGHHGDRILVLSVRLERAEEVRYVLSTLAGLDDFEGLIDELEERVDENCAFFLQLDKQAAFHGDVELGTGLMLRGKVEAYPATKDRAVETAEATLTELADQDPGAGRIAGDRDDSRGQDSRAVGGERSVSTFETDDRRTSGRSVVTEFVHVIDALLDEIGRPDVVADPEALLSGAP